MLQTRTSRWTAGAAAVCLAVLVASWFLLIGPRRADAAALREQNVSAQQKNDRLQIQIEQLKEQYEQLPHSQADLAAVLQQLPATQDMPHLVRSLDTMAKDCGVSLMTITPGQPTRLSAPGGTAAASTADSTTSALSVVQTPMSLVVSGDYFQTLVFLKKLQTQGPRAFLVSGLDASPSKSTTSTAGSVDLTITGDVFTIPLTSALTTRVSSSAGSASTASTP